MNKRDKFIEVVNTFKNVSTSITDIQRRGLLKQAVHNYDLSVEEASEILNSLGLVVGKEINYFEVLKVSIEQIQESDDQTIAKVVEAAHDQCYRESLRAGARVRLDGKTEEQWRRLLNQARDTLIDPLKRREHLEILQDSEVGVLFEEKATSILKPSDIDTTESQHLSKETTLSDLKNSDDMVYISAGEFLMGGKGEKANEREKPVHTVYTDAFYIDKFPVTNAQFKEFIDANPQWRRPTLFRNKIPISYNSRSYLRDWFRHNHPTGKSNHPVTWVSWYAAMAYAQWVGKRLPTEAEWEKAARGGIEDNKYPWGDSVDSDNANYFYHIGGTTPVGRYPPNRYGLYDMCGNVWDWCLDAYIPNFYGVSPHQNPFSEANTIEWVAENFLSVKTPRVVRGGSWNNDDQDIRISHRFRCRPVDTLPTLGLRCVKELHP